MGEVYRARDSKLKREVAIKVVPDEFSRDAERLHDFNVKPKCWTFFFAAPFPVPEFRAYHLLLKTRMMPALSSLGWARYRTPIKNSISAAQALILAAAFLASLEPTRGGKSSKTSKVV